MASYLKKTFALVACILACSLSLAHPADNDSTSVAVKRGPDRIFMPKGDVSTGIQFFHLNLDSSNSELALILQHLDASGEILSISPYFDYTYKDNRSIGMRSKFSSVSGGVSNADLSMLNEGFEMSVQDIKAKSKILQSEIYHRSYAALDERGRFGVFMDVALSWSRTDTSFSYNAKSLDTSSVAQKLRVAAHPGLMIFVMNNLSTHVSIGIGGAQVTKTDYMKNGEKVGDSCISKVNFMLDILDISYGLSLHF